MDLPQAILIADTWVHGGWGWGWMALMMVVMVLFWAAVIVGLVWLIRSAGRGSWSRERSVREETPVEILERRFAEGEISEEDYRARREVLNDRGDAVSAA